MDNKENKSQLIIYQAEDGKIKIDVRFQGETAWLSQTGGIINEKG